MYELYNIHDLKFDGIYWSVIPRQLPTALALFFVVAFGSSLDVAAIQQDSPEPLDYNKELVTVGKMYLGSIYSGSRVQTLSPVTIQHMLHFDCVVHTHGHIAVSMLCLNAIAILAVS